jgi:hypothetical protein
MRRRSGFPLRRGNYSSHPICLLSASNYSQFETRSLPANAHCFSRNYANPVEDSLWRAQISLLPSSLTLPRMTLSTSGSATK